MHSTQTFFNFSLKSMLVILGAFSIIIAVGAISQPTTSTGLPMPSRQGDQNGKILRLPADKESALLKQLAPHLRDYDTLRSSKLIDGYMLEKYLNSAIALASAGNCDAEYTVGWMYENSYCKNDRLQGKVCEFLCNYANTDIYSLVTADADTETAKQWYVRAASHDSPQAITATVKMNMSNMETSKTSKLKSLEKAIRLGDVEANIDLGQAYEFDQFGIEADYAKAMAHYERALSSKDHSYADSALMNILRLWKEHYIAPSKWIRNDAPDCLYYMRQFEPNMTLEDFSHFFRYEGFAPEPYNALRWEMLPKIKKKLNIKVEQ